MKANVGSYDGAVRFFLGIALFGSGIHYESWWGLLGLIPLSTAVAAFCPLYCLFHIDTTWTDRPRA